MAQTTTTTPQAWMNEARCSRFPEILTKNSDDKAYDDTMQMICRLGCPVMKECLQWAFATQSTEMVFGGLNPEERRLHRRRERAGYVSRICTKCVNGYTISTVSTPSGQEIIVEEGVACSRCKGTGIGR